MTEAKELRFIMEKLFGYPLNALSAGIYNKAIPSKNSESKPPIFYQRFRSYHRWVSNPFVVGDRDGDEYFERKIF